MALRHGIAISLVATFATTLASCSSGDSSAPTTIETPTVASVTVSGAGTVEAGKSVRLTASVIGTDGQSMAGKPLTWSSSNQTVATVAADGTVTGIAPGIATIGARADNVTGTLAMTVIAAVASVTITGTTSIQAGQTTKLTAQAKDASGAVLTNVPITWSSSDATLISVASDGTVTAAHIADVTITATAGAKSATVAFSSSLTPYTFTFPAVTSVSDQQVIKDAVQFAHRYYLTTFGKTVLLPTSITTLGTTGVCAAGNAAATTTSGSAIFCTSNLGWTTFGATLKGKIVMHELFHIWQFEAKWIGAGSVTSPTWLVEGSAEMMGFRATAARNLLSYGTALGCQVKQAADFAAQQPPGLPALNLVESLQAFQTTAGPLYTTSMLGADQLVTTPGLIALKVYSDALATGTAWPTAFQSAFATSSTTFYAQFPGYLAGQTVPVNYLCGGL